MKIRAYLLVMAVAILAPVILFSTLALATLLESERLTALRGLHESARATALMVDRDLLSAEAALKVLALSPHLESGNLHSFYDQAKAADRESGAWTLLLDGAGRQLVNTAVLFGTPL